MASGLFALLDDVAALVKIASASIDDVGAAATKAGVKAAGVVVDDTAVTPRYVHNLNSKRELPIIWRIAKSSLRNKLIFILPVALILSEWFGWALTPLLMVGGLYLCFEGAEKVWGKYFDHDHGESAEVIDFGSKEYEDNVVKSATRTDFILSSEIMVIALNEVSEEPFVSRAITLAIVALGITALVYGVVGLIVKTDDFGLSLANGSSSFLKRVGLFLVRSMPSFMGLLSSVGVVAMFWVGGHILLVGFDDLGWSWLYDMVHHLEGTVADFFGFAAGFWKWFTNTLASAVFGVFVGSLAAWGLWFFKR